VPATLAGRVAYDHAATAAAANSTIMTSQRIVDLNVVVRGRTTTAAFVEKPVARSITTA
jgi:hypothetical protein